MFKSFKNKNKGFTLIELLVVIAIIGILSSVVLASLSTARQKSRDAKRISDIGQVQLALELYFDRSQSYPSTSASICGAGGNAACTGTVAIGATGNDSVIVGLADLYNKFLPKAPVPSGGANGAVAYYYYGTDSNQTASCVGASCVSYVLGSNLERNDNTVLGSDTDTNTLPLAVLFSGVVANCGSAGNTAVGTDQCYDIKP